jgi:hypothetical protein
VLVCYEFGEVLLLALGFAAGFAAALVLFP